MAHFQMTKSAFLISYKECCKYELVTRCGIDSVKHKQGLFQLFLYIHILPKPNSVNLEYIVEGEVK